jgi:predicted dehydrogenase
VSPGAGGRARRGRRRHRHRVVDRNAPRPRRACVLAGIPTFCEKPVAAVAQEAVALRDELSGNDTPIQIGFPRRFDVATWRPGLRSRRASWGTCTPSVDDPWTRRLRPRPTSAGRRHLNDCAIHDSTPSRTSPGRRSSRSTPRHEPGSRLHRGRRRRGVGHLHPHDERRTLAVVRTADPTAAATTSAWRCWAARTRWPRARRPPAAQVRGPRVAFPSGAPGTSSWTASRRLPRGADRLHRSRGGSRPPPARSTTASRRLSSPRPPPAPGVSTGRCASTTSADSQKGRRSPRRRYPR